jgi:pimeloyl-ACP methyl ester carboxylesterase
MPSSWTIAGSDGQPIIGNCHRPVSSARGAIFIAHGFKGYKDYGLFPRLADSFAAAGFIAHRFNFSHSGMTESIETFQRPELFERDTWNRQVFDLRAVIELAGTAPVEPLSERPPALPYFIFGHSRGGVTAQLTAGRFADDPTFPQPAGIITAAAPATCNPLSADEQQQLLRDGYLITPSSRTGQALRIGREFLSEQLDDPESHDLLAQVARIRCPLLIVHGEADPTVPMSAAHAIAAAVSSSSQARVMIIRGGDHVFNTPNPLSPESPSSQALAALIDAAVRFASQGCGV